MSSNNQVRTTRDWMNFNKKFTMLAESEHEFSHNNVPFSSRVYTGRTVLLPNMTKPATLLDHQSGHHDEEGAWPRK